MVGWLSGRRRDTSARGRVARAMEVVPRVDFLPPEARDQAHEDVPLRIGHGATNSQPSTVAAMLELLDACPGHRVLDVGAGSGWTTALLAHLVGGEGSVLGVELVPELAADAQDRVSRSRMPQARVVPAVTGVLGWPTEGPYDRILVSAMAETTPTELVDQLADDGARMVAPVDGRMLVVDRDGGRTRRWEAPGYYRFVPLR
ncbi:protein-L-isoaspartate O-methyltransferase family protein [Ornithinimicrobium sp. Y1847]|uniref:protein-L-isoaspartate O-methyltransferase family protein n=1 Tax=unclassified Ornithinimicrobium TaxID=2615080 RepID=UPI003B6853D8